MKTNFLASTNHFLHIFSRILPVKAFFPFNENESFLNESFILDIEKDFLSGGNRLLYLRFFFY